MSVLTLRSGCCRGRHRRDIARCCRLSHKPAKAKREALHPCAPSLSSFCFCAFGSRSGSGRIRRAFPGAPAQERTERSQLQRAALRSGAPSGWQRRHCWLGCCGGEGAKIGHVAPGGGEARRAPTLEETAEWRLRLIFFFFPRTRGGTVSRDSVSAKSPTPPPTTAPNTFQKDMRSLMLAHGDPQEENCVFFCVYLRHLPLFYTLCISSFGDLAFLFFTHNCES